MGNVHLVTGYAGERHVTAADHGSLNSVIFGDGEYVLDRGSKFAASIISNNLIRIDDGEIMMQGRHIRLNEGQYVEATIENGTQGMLRHDLIVVRYTMDTDTGIEDCNMITIKGMEAASNPIDPEYTSGNIIEDHAVLNDMPLYRVVLNGLSIEKIVPLFTEASLGLELLANAVATNNIKDEAVTKGKLAPKSVTKDKLAEDAVATNNIKDEAVTKGKLAPKSVSKDKLGSDAFDDLPKVSNPNLLDNWYFGNPVNQRGQTSYSGAGYGIDRWSSNTSTMALTINEDSVSVSASTPWCGFYQVIENPSWLNGQTITMSVLLNYNHNIVVSLKNDTKSGMAQVSTTPSAGFLSYTTTIPADFASDGDDVKLYMYITQSASESVTAKLYAAKLELGDTQTLAHQDSSGNWVLNEIPNYADQLARCQRYFVSLRGGSTDTFPSFGVGFSAGTDQAYVLVNLPVPIRTAPSVIMKGSFRANESGGIVIIPASVSYAYQSTRTSLRLLLSTEAKLTRGSLVMLQANNDATADVYISADL